MELSEAAAIFCKFPDNLGRYPASCFGVDRPYFFRHPDGLVVQVFIALAYCSQGPADGLFYVVALIGGAVFDNRQQGFEFGVGRRFFVPGLALDLSFSRACCKSLD